MPAENAYEWMQARNEDIVKLLDQNHNVSQFIFDFLAHLTTYCRDKGLNFEDVIIDQPFIGDDEFLRARIAIRRV